MSFLEIVIIAIIKIAIIVSAILFQLLTSFTLKEKLVRGRKTELDLIG